MVSFSRYFTVCITYQPPLVHTAFYGWETWSLSVGEEQRLWMSENEVLIGIFVTMRYNVMGRQRLQYVNSTTYYYYDYKIKDMINRDYSMHTNPPLAVYVHFAHNIYPCVSFLTHSTCHMRLSCLPSIYTILSSSCEWSYMEQTDLSLHRLIWKKNNAFLNVWHSVWRKFCLKKFNVT